MSFASWPSIFPGEHYVLPSKWCYVPEGVEAWVLAGGMQIGDNGTELEGVPIDDGSRQQVYTRGPIGLVLTRPVTNLAESVEGKCPLESVVRLAFVEPGLSAALQIKIC